MTNEKLIAVLETAKAEIATPQAYAMVSSNIAYACGRKSQPRAQNQRESKTCIGQCLRLSRPQRRNLRTKKHCTARG